MTLGVNVGCLRMFEEATAPQPMSDIAQSQQCETQISKSVGLHSTEGSAKKMAACCYYFTISHVFPRSYVEARASNDVFMMPAEPPFYATMARARSESSAH